MSTKPYESSREATPVGAGMFAATIAWILILVGVLAAILGFLMIVSNGYIALQSGDPFRIKLLKLFVFTGIGSLPVFFGLALQYYARRFLRWRTRLRMRA